MKKIRTTIVLALAIFASAFVVKADTCTGKGILAGYSSTTSVPFANRATVLYELDVNENIVDIIDTKHTDPNGYVEYFIPYCGKFKVTASQRNLVAGYWVIRQYNYTTGMLDVQPNSNDIITDFTVYDSSTEPERLWLNYWQPL